MKTVDTYRLHVYMDRRGDWRWRIVCTTNGRKVANAGEGYSTRGNAIRAARRLRVIVPLAKLIG